MKTINFRAIQNHNLQFIQHLDTGKNEGVLYLDHTLDEYIVIPNKVNPSVDVQLDLILFASEIAAKIQRISLQSQLSISNLI